MNHLNAAITTAARYQIAAPEQAPSLEVNGALGGAFVLGLIVATALVVKWRSKQGGMTDGEKKYVVAAVVMTVCLYGGGGILGQIFTTVKQTADTTGNTITQTAVTR